MTLATDDKRFITQKIALVGLGVSLLSSSIVGVFVVRSLVTAIKELFAHSFADSGDTPVVLVGGSMTFKAGAYKAGQSWMQDDTGYHVSPSYQISTIVLKTSAPPDNNDSTNSGDANPGTDKLRVDVSASNSWEIDEFSVAGGNTNPVVKIFPQQNGPVTEIHLVLLDNTGKLCPVTRKNVRLRYIPNIQTCPNPPLPDDPPTGSPPVPPVLSQISIKLNGEANPSGTLSCFDSGGDPAGKCRIALKGTPP
jgi:hypothetical protein